MVATRAGSPAHDRHRVKGLRRADIIGTAIRISRGGQLGELSMRDLARRLHVTPMALYAHVRDKGEILDEVLDHLLTTSATPQPASDDWRSWFVEFAAQLHDLLCQQPALLDRYLQRPVGVPAALRRMEAALGVLSQVGFDDESAVDVYAAVHTFTLGFTTLEVARISGLRSTEMSVRTLSEGRTRFGSEFFADLPLSEFPHLTRIRPDLADFTSGERFRRVLTELVRSFTPSQLTTRETTK